MVSQAKPASQSNQHNDIGIYEGHVFLIKSIEKLAKIFKCVKSRARFTIERNLKRHAERCAQGKSSKEKSE